MCSTPKITSVSPVETEVIKDAVQADASVSKATPENRGVRRGLTSENIRTSNIGLSEEIIASKKKLLGE